MADEIAAGLTADHRLPGWTIDAFLAEGNLEDAHAEVERLIQVGIDSGPGVAMTEEWVEKVAQRARARAGTR